MGIDLKQPFNDLIAHAGHSIDCVTYGYPGKDASNVAIECQDCGVVLIDADRPNPDKTSDRD